jgi:cellulose biosynthesis protein BcsQ
MGIIISTVNMKGGVGKTTLSVNLATCLAKDYQKKVLVLDLDAQISATLSLMPPHDFAKTRRKRKTLSYLLEQIIRPNPHSNLSIDDIILPATCGVKGLDLLPGDIELYDEYIVSEVLHQEAQLAEGMQFEQIWNRLERVLVKKTLEPVLDRYDYVIMDCAPGYNLLTRSGIATSDFYLIPARPEPLSVVGMQLLERRINKLKNTYEKDNPVHTKLLGVVFILSAGGLLSRYYNQVMRRVREDFTPQQLFETAIPMDVNVAKSVDMFMPVVLGIPNSGGAKAFSKVTEEFLQKIQA